MTEFLVKRFIKDYESVEKMSVRTAYSVLASMVGIFCNVILFVVKLLIGMMLHSVSVMADAFNNLSDAGSSIIGYVGVKMAEKPADKEHPFGHGRMEYIAAFIVAFLIMEVGFSFLKDSISKITNPEEMKFQVASVGILILSVVVKWWLGVFNRDLGERIDSKVLKAVFADSMGDVAITSVTILSLVFYQVTQINVDGFVGVGVALAVMWAGFSIAKDTLEPLLGEAVDADLYAEVISYVEKHDGIIGTHDLIVHNYGPNRNMASIHAEIPNHMNVVTAHMIIDEIEKGALEELGIFLVIHMDPVETKDEDVLQIRQQVEQYLEEKNLSVNLHDFHVSYGSKGRINIVFDMVVPYSYSEREKEKLMENLIFYLKELNPKYSCVITMEHSFVDETAVLGVDEIQKG